MRLDVGAGGGTDVITLAQILSTISTPTLLALIALAYAFGWVYSRKAYERERDRADALQKFVTEEMVPALTRATDALRERTDPGRRR